MKLTLKNFVISICLFLMGLVVVVAVDRANGIPAQGATTSLRVTVVGLDGLPVHNAQVVVMGDAFNTDNKGLSPVIGLGNFTNCYDDKIKEWGTVTVKVFADGYVPAVALNCVVYFGQTRNLTVKIYPADGSNLPYVCYVESPPDSYLKQLVSDGK